MRLFINNEQWHGPPTPLHKCAYEWVFTARDELHISRLFIIAFFILSTTSTFHLITHSLTHAMLGMIWFFFSSRAFHSAKIFTSFLVISYGMFQAYNICFKYICDVKQIVCTIYAFTCLTSHDTVFFSLAQPGHMFLHFIFYFRLW